MCEYLIDADKSLNIFENQALDINRLHYTITLWFPCLDGLIQTRGNVARVKKSA
jgi:hypothetical protein